MGGHAFRDLNCPRISKEVYLNAKQHTTAALRTIFSYVVVPTEMPEKEDYGDIDFLVSDPFHSPESTSMDSFDWTGTVQAIKYALGTTYGRRGFKNPGCMYFAIRAPCIEDVSWIQVDVKVCFKSDLFEWSAFELNYASNSKILGSMVKPLGLTMDPEGLHIRVEDIDETNFPGSMVRIGKDPRDVLRIMGLDRRIVNAGFRTKDEIYEYFAGSWLFNSAHFTARLTEEKYLDRLENRSPHWTYFIKTWVPEHYPGNKFTKDTALLEKHITVSEDQQIAELRVWYQRTRAAVRDKTFTMFPHVATKYYIRRALYVKEKEEKRLRTMITAAIPIDNSGWTHDLPQPRIIIEQPDADKNTPEAKPTAIDELTPPLTPTNKIFDIERSFLGFTLSSLKSPTNSSLIQSNAPWDVPVYVDRLTRTPERVCRPGPPPVDMSPDRKLVCLARWTFFDPVSGTPRLLSTPRNKDCEMHWTDATYAGTTDKILVEWARDMWWHVWVRQCHVNYVGMWKRRLEKEDQNTKKKRQEEEAKTEAEKTTNANREKLLGRLEALNIGLGLVEGDSKAV